MLYLRSVLLGVCIAGVLGGVWWIIVGAGVFRLLLGRSYAVLGIGVLLDIIFIHTSGTPFLFAGFYTPIFLLTTISTEAIRARMLWTS